MKFISNFEPDRLSKPIIEVEDQDRIPVLEMLLLGLRQRKRLQKRHLVFGSEHLKLYFGFQESFQVLLNMADPDAGNGGGANTLGESLAEHSSLLVDEDRHYLSTHWGMVNFSAGGLLLSTDESDFTSPIQIGHIVSFAPVDKVQQPLIGYVCRLHRPQDQRVEIAIVRLSSYAEAVSVWDDMEEGDTSGRLVILVQDLDEQWKLIIHNSFGFVSGVPLKLLRVDGEQVPVRLGDVWLTKSEFTVFDVSSPGMQRYDFSNHPH